MDHSFPRPPTRDTVQGLMIAIGAGRVDLGWGWTQLKSQSPVDGLYLSINKAAARTFNCIAGFPHLPPLLICLPQITAHKLGACRQIGSFRKNRRFSPPACTRDLILWTLVVFVLGDGKPLQQPPPPPMPAQLPPPVLPPNQPG